MIPFIRRLFYFYREALTDIASGFASALPFGLRHDVLNVWATFRLRRHPLKIMSWVAILGIVCFYINMGGDRWVTPQLTRLALRITTPTLQDVMIRVAGALFSSLNILSCLSTVVIWRTMRFLLQEGHIEALQLVPARFRPSALFYAMGMRYIPLAFIAILVIFLSPTRSPFRDFPFKMILGMETSLLQQYGNATPVIINWAMVWAALDLLGTTAFCVTNLFMDLVIAYWTFSRIRVSYLAMILAVAFIGLGTPVILMYAIHRIDMQHPYIMDQAQRLAEWVAGSQKQPLPNVTLHASGYILRSTYYFLASFVQVLTAWLLLAHLDVRWNRILRSPRRDPVLFKLG